MLLTSIKNCLGILGREGEGGGEECYHFISKIIFLPKPHKIWLNLQIVIQRFLITFVTQIFQDTFVWKIMCVQWILPYLCSYFAKLEWPFFSPAKKTGPKLGHANIDEQQQHSWFSIFFCPYTHLPTENTVSYHWCYELCTGTAPRQTQQARDGDSPSRHMQQDWCGVRGGQRQHCTSDGPQTAQRKGCTIFYSRRSYWEQNGERK